MWMDFARLTLVVVMSDKQPLCLSRLGIVLIHSQGRSEIKQGQRKSLQAQYSLTNGIPYACGRHSARPTLQHYDKSFNGF